MKKFNTEQEKGYFALVAIITLVLLSLLLVGCGQNHYMSNQEMIDATKLCRDNDMRAVHYTNAIGTSSYIRCHPGKKEQK